MRGTREARLGQLGMTYRQYLESDLWAQAKARYRASGRPRRCVICGAVPYQLHHITYQRLGKELPGDLLPLCVEHHEQVHWYERTHPTQLHCISKIIRQITGWSRKQVASILGPFNANGIKDAELHMDVLTPRQRQRVHRNGRKRRKVVRPPVDPARDREIDEGLVRWGLDLP